MGALGAVGKFAGPGLVALSTGLAALGTAPVLLGLAGVALAAIGLGYALNLAAPAIKEVGTAVTNIFTILSKNSLLCILLSSYLLLHLHSQT